MDFCLPAGCYQFNFEVMEQIHIPAFSGSTLRGVLGWALMRLGGLTVTDVNNKNALYQHSVYAAVFDPCQHHSKQALKFHKSSLPVPYVLNVPWHKEERYEEGDIFSFKMVLMSSALTYLPTIITAWRQAFLRGISANHTGKAKLLNIVHLDGAACRPIFSAEKPAIIQHQAILQPPHFTHNSDVRLDFHTPLRIQSKGKVLVGDDLTASILLRNMVRRVSICMQLSGHTFTAEQALKLNALADQVVAQKKLRKATVKRYSNRQRAAMQLHGVLGEWHLLNVPKELLPVIWLCQYLHVGKNTSFGLGGFTITTSL